MHVVDTNVISELMRPVPNGSVAQWIHAQPIDELAITAVTVARDPIRPGPDVRWASEGRPSHPVHRSAGARVSRPGSTFRRGCCSRLRQDQRRPGSGWAADKRQRCHDRGHCANSRCRRSSHATSPISHTARSASSTPGGKRTPHSADHKRRLATRRQAKGGREIMRIEVLVDVKTTLGEGPLWDVEEQRLYWIDSFDGRVFRCTADGREVRSWDVPMKIGSMCLRQQGGAVLSLARGFHFLDFASGEVTLIHDPEPDKPNNRINDGKVDQRGRFVAGSMDTMEEGGNGSLYRLDPDLKITRLEGDIIVSNGPCWAPDGKTFYFTDSWSGQISAYDYDLDTGSIANKRAFARMDVRWRRLRRRHGRCRGWRLERHRLCRQADPLRPRRPGRPGDRHAGQEGDQRQFRRPEPRHPLRHLDGQAALAALPRRPAAARCFVRDPRAGRAWRAGAPLRRLAGHLDRQLADAVDLRVQPVTAGDGGDAGRGAGEDEVARAPARTAPTGRRWSPAPSRSSVPGRRSAAARR